MPNAAVQTATRVVFEPTNHHYFVDGIRKPSVTEILKETGVSTDFEEIGSFSERLREKVAFKRDLGTALHADIHAADDGDLDWDTVDDRVLPYLEAWMIFRENTGLMPLARERVIFHPSLDYCGTFDGIFRTPGGVLVLLDAKTGDPHDAAANFQTAGYLLAYGCQHPENEIGERWSVQLAPSRKVPYVITQYTDWNDFTIWQSIVATYWQQATRRRRHV
jgi:hypothetical protein